MADALYFLAFLLRTTDAELVSVRPVSTHCSCYEFCTDAACPVHGTQADGEVKP